MYRRTFLTMWRFVGNEGSPFSHYVLSISSYLLLCSLAISILSFELVFLSCICLHFIIVIHLKIFGILSKSLHVMFHFLHDGNVYWFVLSLYVKLHSNLDFYYLIYLPFEYKVLLYFSVKSGIRYQVSICAWFLTVADKIDLELRWWKGVLSTGASQQREITIKTESYYLHTILDQQ